MAEVINNRYTVGGVTYDAKTGQPTNDAGLTPTAEQLAARTSAANASGTNVHSSLADAESALKSSAPGAAPVSRYTSDLASLFAPGGAYGTIKPPTADEQVAIRETERKKVQAQIDAINELSAQELAAAQQRGVNRAGQTRALGAATGTLGSGRQGAQEEKTTAFNAAEESAIRSAANAKIQDILVGVQNRADDSIDKQKTLARTNADEYQKYLKTTASQALADMESLATAGATLSTTQRQALIDQSGYSPETFDTLYKSLSIANNSDYINKDKPEIVGNKAVFFKQTKDPKTGAISLTTETLDLPISGTVDPKNIDVVSRKDGIYMLNKADGTFKRVGQPEPTAGNGNGTGGLYSEFDYRTGNAILSQVGQFDDNAVTKKFNAILDARNNVASFDASTKNPADHQAIIYAFAKALDPDSVVREGEYATIKKYSQNIISRYGKEVENAVAGTGFLSKGAIENIKSTIENRYKASLPQYENAYKNASRNIDQVSGVPGTGEKYLKDARGGFADANTYAPGSTVYVDGVAYTVADNGDDLIPQ